MLKKISVLSAVMLLFTLTACLSVKQNVIDETNVKFKTTSVEIVEDSSSLKISENAIFEENLYKNLAKSGFSKNNENRLKIQYKFVEYDKGNRALRIFTGILGPGKGKLIVEIRYFDNKNTIIAATSTEAVMRGGFWGGNFKDAVIEASEKISQYTVKNFK